MHNVSKSGSEVDLIVSKLDPNVSEVDPRVSKVNLKPAKRLNLRTLRENQK